MKGWIWENAKPIIEEKIELQRVQAEEMKKNNDDYTSLYWNPGEENGNKSENEYEVVEESNRFFGGGLLRGIRESLLRELRKDLARLARPMVYGVSSHRNSKLINGSAGKCVNLRPGLALGVITLQAGSRQKITVH